MRRPFFFVAFAFTAVVILSPAGGFSHLSARDPAGLGNGPASALRVHSASVPLAHGAPPVNWTLLTPTTSPTKRAESSMVFDGVDGYFLLFGGHDGNTLLGDTWTFTVSGGWVQLHPALAPHARRGATMVYDAFDGYVVLFGGSDYKHYLNDTWKFHGGRWTPITSPLSPPARRVAGALFQATTHQVVLFGGHSGSLNHPPLYSFFNDTWTFQAGVWSRLATNAAPAPRGEPMFVDDAPDGYLLAFGGYNATTTFGDTWTLRGNLWTNISSRLNLSPPARDGASIAYDPNASGVVMFGGHNGAVIFKDTWWFQHGAWSVLHPAVVPPNRGGVPLAWDRSAGYGVMFAGLGKFGWLNDTWQLRP